MDPFLSQERVFTLLILVSGAAIAFISAWITAYLNQKRDNRLNRLSALETEAREAQLGFVKLMLLQEAGSSIYLTMMRQVDRYSGAEFLEMPLCHKVRGVANTSDKLRGVEPSEVAFLFRSNQPMCFSEIFSLEKRIHALYGSIQYYAEQREGLITTLEPFFTQSVKNFEHLTTVDIPAPAQLEVERKTNSLNRTIERIIAEAFELQTLGRKLCDIYLVESQCIFGEFFPSVSINWEQSKNSAFSAEGINVAS
jgi:hypothetical protein